jgi:hypothetical protein
MSELQIKLNKAILRIELSHSLIPLKPPKSPREQTEFPVSSQRLPEGGLEFFIISRVFPFQNPQMSPILRPLT